MSRPRVPAAVVAAAASAIVLACGSAPPSASRACAASDAVWVASDYSSSAVGSVTLAGGMSAVAGRPDLGADPVLARSRGRLFYVARDEDALFELDPVCGAPTARFDAHLASGTGTSDPYDVAVASDGSLWIPLFEAGALLVLAPDGTQAATIDLSSYDGDGNPDASAVAIVDTPGGEKAFVALDRLNPYPQSVQASWMLRIDVATRAVEATVPLSGRNPFGQMQLDGAVLWLAEPGNYDDATEADAGVERFDTSTSTTALVVREPDLGGSVAEVAVSGGCGVVIVAGPEPDVNPTALATFDPDTGAVSAAASASPLATDGFDLEGLAWLPSKGGALLVGDRRRASSGYPVHVFDRPGGGCSPVERASPVLLPLPPIAIAAGPS